MIQVFHGLKVNCRTTVGGEMHILAALLQDYKHQGGLQNHATVMILLNVGDVM